MTFARIVKKNAFFCAVLCAVLFFSCSSVEKKSLVFSLSDESESDAGFVETFKKKDTQFFVFSQEQNSLIKSYSENLPLGIAVTFDVGKVPPKKDSHAELAFLFDEDFSGGKIKRCLSERRSVCADFAEFENDSVTVLYSFSKDGQIPCGFFVKTRADCAVTEIKIRGASLGFDFSLESELYAFSSSGGILKRKSTDINLLSAVSSFSEKNSNDELMPEIVFTLKENSPPVKAVFGGEEITIRSGGSGTVSIPAAGLKSPFSEFSIAENADCVLSVLVRNSSEKLLEKSLSQTGSPVYPYKVDPGLIVKWRRENWRGEEYELFEWDRFEGILFFDTADYAVQDEFFRRLAYFVEKKGFKGKLLSDDFLEGKHGYNAHDYRAEDLARFFETARREHFPLNEKELLLKEILILNGVINQNETDGITGGTGAVISISRESPEYLRTTFIAHEGWHGIYFVDDEFRNTSAAIYYSLLARDPKSVGFLTRYFEVTPTLNYDTGDDYLLKNEFMAYMMQRPVSAVEEYYVNMASRPHAQSRIKEEADHIIETKAAGFAGAAQMFDDYVRRRWNLSAGRVWLLSR